MIDLPYIFFPILVGCSLPKGDELTDTSETCLEDCDESEESDSDSDTSDPSDSDPSEPSDSDTSDPSDSDPSDPSDSDPSDPSSDDTATDDSSDPTTDDASEEICLRWNDDRVDLSEGSWSGNLPQCDAGDISSQGRENALRQVNLYRWLADLPPVTTDADKDEAAQACALIMHAYGGLTHTPNSSFTCYTPQGGDAAGMSNISPYAGVYSVDLYMSDPMNETTLGHRRWILSNSLGPIGLGSTSGYSCMHVIYGSGNAGKDWVAYPPAGVVPIEMFEVSWQDLDTSGWSVQSDAIDLSSAQVTVTRDDGQVLDMAVRVLDQYYGSTYAISMIPQGWSTESDRSYTVELTGVNPEISYTVSPVTCQE